MASLFLSSVEPLESRIAPAGANVDLTNLAGVNGFRINGEAADDEFGRDVAGAGDINGDGIDDLIIGASRAASSGVADSGACYVVFGTPDGFGANLELSTLNGTNGFKISGEAAGDFLGATVSSAGDLNGDGVDDVIIAALFADGNGLRDSGAAYVIFGSTTGFAANLNLAALTGTNGFKISGDAANLHLGFVSGVGDFNGDAIDDVIIGAPGTDSTPGAAYVLFGSTSSFPSNLSLSALSGSVGLKISGETVGDDFGRTVSGAGDINGDAINDVIIGAPLVDASGADSGAVYVIFGSASAFGAPFGVNALTGANGFKISSEGAGDLLGFAASGAGDVNGDAIDDVIVGAIGAHPHGPDSGAAYVVFGSAGGFAANVNLSELNGSNGFRMSGEAHGDIAGVSVSGAGDINADGFDDVIVGAFRADPNGSESGSSYVVLGKSRGFAANLDLSKLSGSDGFKIAGERPGDQVGRSVSSAGDLNGDGISDYVIGATFSDANGTDSGTTYVVFGAPAVQIDPSTVLFVEADGDEVTIKLKGGNLFPQDVTRDADGNIGTLDITHLAGPQQAIGAKALNFSITAKTPLGGVGNGFAKVGLLNATGVGLGKVKLQGDLDRLLAGNGSGTAAAKSIFILGNLGSATGAPQISRLFGQVQKMTIGGTVQKNPVQIDGKVKVIAVGGDLIGAFPVTPTLLSEIAAAGFEGIVEQGNALPPGVLLAESIGSLKIGGNVKGGGIVTTKDLGSFSVLKDFSGGLFSDGGIKAVKVVGKMTSDDPAVPSTITARNRLDSLIINGDVQNARILAGYSKDEVPINADARIGRVVVKGDWTASSLVAGIDDSTANGFGQNDTVIAGDTTPSVLSSIASIVIKGTASGSAAPGDHFGLTAQRIGKLSIDGNRIPLSKDAVDDLLLDGTNNDFRVVEVT